MTCIRPIVLAGGGGTRLWPVSRHQHPKPFVPLLGESTLFGRTLQRLDRACAGQLKTVVCGDKHRRDAWREVAAAGMEESTRILTEPSGRNTAPAVLLALLDGFRDEVDDVVAVFPADHLIENDHAFQSCLTAAESAARRAGVVTFGIPPSHAETGFGYMEIETDPKPHTAHPVLRFIEKPDRDRAQRFVDAGRFFWNSGIFVFRPSTMLKAFQRYQPDMVEAMTEYLERDRDPSRYAELPKISLDVAIMEKLDNIALIPATFDWSDVGSWDTVHGFSTKDRAGNSLVGDGVLHSSRGCLLHAAHRFVVGLNLRDIIIVETADAVLVASRGSTQDVRKVADAWPENSGCHKESHSEKNRAKWGWAACSEETADSVMWRHEVQPGQSMSVESIKGGNRTLVVLSGTAQVSVNARTQSLGPAASVDIPGNAPCCIENAEEHKLVVLEIRSKKAGL